MLTQNLQRRIRSCTRIATLLGLCLLGGACKTYHDYDAFIHEPRPIVTSTEYRVAPPDVVLITSKSVRELNGHQERVRPDGKLTLPLLGSVFVADLTTEEISSRLEEMAREYYEEADISVRVTGYNSKKIFVFGEVSAPGSYSYHGANTVLDTLAAAQPTRLADPGRIHLMRPNADGELIRRMTVDLDKMVKQGDTSLNAVLEEGDIVYVPPNALAAVGLAFQQLLLPLQPAAATVQAPADIGTSTQRRPYSNAHVDTLD